MGIEISNYQYILRSRAYGEKTAVDKERDVMVRVTIKVDNQDGNIERDNAKRRLKFQRTDE